MTTPVRPSISPPPGPRAAALLVALALASGCSPRDTSAEELAASTGARTRQAPKVRTERVERREMVQYLETTTVLESEFDIDLFARRPGEVTELLAEEGDRVAEGQVLARLDDREERLAVEESEIAFEEAEQAVEQTVLAVEEARAVLAASVRAATQAERDYQRDARLYESADVASPLSEKAVEASRLARDTAVADREQAEIALRRAELDEKKARTTVRKSQSALERARLALGEMEIVAPFEGVVAQRNVRLGTSVGSGDFAFKLTDPLKLRAVFNRPQRELTMFQAGTRHVNGSTRKGLAITAVAEAIPGRAFEGEVVRVSPTIDRMSGNFRVTAVLAGDSEAEEGPELLPGMLLRLKIATERHPDALVVAKRAVRREGDRSFLFAVTDGKLREVDVTEGFTDDDNVEVTPSPAGALNEGDEIVVVGNRDLEEGQSVEIENDVSRGAVAETEDTEADAPGTEETESQPTDSAAAGSEPAATE